MEANEDYTTIWGEFNAITGGIFISRFFFTFFNFQGSKGTLQ